MKIIQIIMLAFIFRPIGTSDWISCREFKKEAFGAVYSASRCNTGVRYFSLNNIEIQEAFINPAMDNVRSFRESPKGPMQ